MRGAGPGTRPCPGGCAAYHVEVQVGIFTASHAVLLLGQELCLVPVVVVERALIVKTTRGAGQSGFVVESEGEPPLLATAASAARAVKSLHRDSGQAGEAWFLAGMATVALRVVRGAVVVPGAAGDADLSVAVLAVLVARQVADGVGALAVGVVLARLLARAVDAGESRLTVVVSTALVRTGGCGSWSKRCGCWSRCCGSWSRCCCCGESSCCFALAFTINALFASFAL